MEIHHIKLKSIFALCLLQLHHIVQWAATASALYWLPALPWKGNSPLENGGSPMAVYKVEVSSCQEVWIEVAITPMLM